MVLPVILAKAEIRFQSVISAKAGIRLSARHSRESGNPVSSFWIFIDLGEKSLDPRFRGDDGNERTADGQGRQADDSRRAGIAGPFVFPGNAAAATWLHPL